MSTVLVVYATREGHTRKIAEHVAGALRARGVGAEAVNVQNPGSIEISRYAAVVLAASIHLGKHEREMRDFVKSNLAKLERVPTTFLSVSLSEAGAEDPAATPSQRAEALANVRRVVEAFVAETRFLPTHVHPIAGALPYRKYGVLVRLVMRMIAKRGGGPTDTSRNHELTDWVALDRVIDEIADEASRVS